MSGLAHAPFPAAADGDASSSGERALRSIIADEIDSARGGLEALVSALCADSHVVGKHLPLLQSIDEISQHYENLAQLLRSEDMTEQVATITLDSLRNRMMRAIAQAGL